MFVCWRVYNFRSVHKIPEIIEAQSESEVEHSEVTINVNPSQNLKKKTFELPSQTVEHEENKFPKQEEIEEILEEGYMEFVKNTNPDWTQGSCNIFKMK